MKTKTVKNEKVPNQKRSSQLWDIMEDAVNNVLERPEGLRGPYLISDTDLLTDMQAV